MPLTDAELAERLNRRRSLASDLLGVEVLSLETAVGAMRTGYAAKPEWCNRMGVVQGGFVATRLYGGGAVRDSACVAQICMPTSGSLGSSPRQGPAGAKPFPAESEFRRWRVWVAIDTGDRAVPNKVQRKV